jgi:uncharacterized MAPEG superfamily protein
MQSSVLTLWCVLVAALMPILCAGIAKWGAFGKPSDEGGYDNHDPRDWLAKQQGYRKRANAAQANCFEALPFFIGAVVLALHMQAPLAKVNALALAFVVLRVLFVLLYLADQPTPRSMVWMAALGVNVTLLFAGVRAS